MKTLSFLSITLFIILFLGANLSFAASVFDDTSTSIGLIKVNYVSTTTAKVKIMIEKDTQKYTYDLLHNGTTENFPLQLGSGKYKISILENISGSSYRLISSQTFDVTITDQNSTYLNSIQNINWNVDSKAVAKAVDLTKGTTDLKKKATLLWTYMAKNNKYDYKKLATLPTSYVPTVDKTLIDKTGICYDFSSLYAAMLRSQGIPAKLVKGYAPKNATGYHAWNEVYDKATSKWIVIDSTYDLQVIAKYPKLAIMSKPVADYQKVYEY
jgi:hypothetical protein